MSLRNLLLIPLSWLFRGVVACRNTAFDRGLLRTTRIGVPVISVGNITVGGTGKTPLTEHIVQYCLGRGLRVAIVSRGYRRHSKGVVVVSDGNGLLANMREAGDEPFQMARKFPLVAVVVGERKVEAARHAVKTFRPDIIVLDDGFQHRYLERDLDIVVVNATRDDFPGTFLPAGRNREPWSSVRRGGLVALSGVVIGGQAEQWKQMLGRWYSGPWLEFRYRLAGLQRLPDHSVVHRDALRNKPVLAFSGIEHHQGFIESVRSLGCTLSSDIEFSDHHVYDERDVQNILGTMEASGAECCITTEKDAIRLMADQHLMERFEARPVLYSRIEVEIVRGKEVLTDLIDKCVTGSVS